MNNEKIATLFVKNYTRLPEIFIFLKFDSFEFDGSDQLWAFLRFKQLCIYFSKFPALGSAPYCWRRTVSATKCNL